MILRGRARSRTPPGGPATATGAQPTRETSGSPWITNFAARTRTGTIVGVIGGYQAGGDTDSISYSVYLNDNIRSLCDQAEAAG